MAWPFSCFISYVLQELLEKIKSSVVDEIIYAYNLEVEKELKILEISYEKAQLMLDSVEGWDLVTSKIHRDCVGDIRGACYDSEDFMDYLTLEIMKTGFDGATNFWSYWRRWGLSRKIRNLQMNLESIANEAGWLIRATEEAPELPPTDINLVIDLVADGTFMRNKEKEEIVETLICPSPATATSTSTTTTMAVSSKVVLMVGMFGIGKTALALAVMIDPQIKLHFELRVRIHFSGHFDVYKAMKGIIRGMEQDQPPLELPSAVDELRGMLQDQFRGRKVLILLDDLWGFVNPHDWVDFQSILLGHSTSTNCSVLITTRNPIVARTVTCLSAVPAVTHYLQKMPDQDCQKLLLCKAQPATSSSKRKRGIMSNITALEIAEKYCKGLPLVANIVGGQLSCKLEYSWPNVIHRDLWDLAGFKEQIFPRFRLNYRDLSRFLKNAFPYFALFPVNYIFTKDDLVRLWIAEGFIRLQVAGGQLSGLEEEEEAGSDCFEEVLSGSILQIHHPFSQGRRPQVYKMHEFIRSYAQYVGSNMYFCFDEQFFDYHSSCNFRKSWLDGNTAWYSKARHLSFVCRRIPPLKLEDIEKCKGLRTLMSLNGHIQMGQVGYSLFLKLQSLRVLNLSGTDITELPESIGTLKHLRLLDLSETDVEELPSSTGNLHALQVLKLNNCQLLLQLPKDARNWTFLLHLEVDIKGLCSMPPNIGRLFNIRTLRGFIVGTEEGYRVTELKNMNNLQGSICITDLENVKDGVEAKEAMLSHKRLLKRLELEWNSHCVDLLLAEEVLAGLEPHKNLKELQVAGYEGARFPDWLSSYESELTSIHLLRCNICNVLPPLGQLQHLKALHIQEMNGVKFVDQQFSEGGDLVGFPLLESLKLQDMMLLEKWDGLEPSQMPLLRDLVITECPNLIALPPLKQLTSLVSLEISYCPELRSLPEEGLPSSLESLIIVESELLKQQCQPTQGDDWEKIKTVPKVVIDLEEIPTPGPEG